ncbi:prepilin-type N-terminal cleavage/methylation domain-containing protein [uncultured Campylobacter sp.]|uniref:type II secretion system protein n=1 Tax=uncultured Campylobacter sp. TaxID=218934 RepID=UPI0026059DC3|nr:prepilin-type N-terminal cleavage/methylation domain-containing protein [uncultured Campylobacter sp.]
MKKGFTMIELIFVIVILGILAAVAIPRLAATRDDAEVSKAASNIQTIVTDLGAYYTSQGNFSSTIADMTNVANPVKAKSDTCFTVGSPANDSISVTIGNTSTLCKQVWEMPGLKQISDRIAKDSGKLKFGGKNVNYN